MKLLALLASVAGVAVAVPAFGQSLTPVATFDH